MSDASSAASAAAADAESLRLRGNESYKSRRFLEAARFYTRALLLSPSSSALFANRAAAWMGLRRWEDAAFDCRAALELEPTFDKARVRLATIEKERARDETSGASASTGASSTATVAAVDSAVASPSESLEVRTSLPNGKHSGLFARRDFAVGEDLFQARATAVVFDRDCPQGRTTRDLLHAVLVQIALEPEVRTQLSTLYPHTDDQLMDLPLIALDDTAPEEADLYSTMCGSSVDLHPALVVPPFARFVRLTCGRLSAKEVLLLHHQLLYNAFAIGNRGGGGPPDAPTGSALYPTASRLNHSCWPNAFGAVVEGEEHTMRVRVVRPIAAGEEVTIAYINMIGPRTTRRKILWDAFEFVCQCERCVRGGDAASGGDDATVDSTVAPRLTPGNEADDLLESVVCTNSSCSGPAGSRGVRGTMVRLCRPPTSAQSTEQQASADYLPFDADDELQCRDCGHTAPAADVTRLLAELAAELRDARAFAQQQSGPSHLSASIDRFTRLVQAAESRLRRPTHWFLPQVYSALGGLYFQRAMQLRSQGGSGGDDSTAALALTAMTSAKSYADAAYHGSRRVLARHSLLLVPLLLTAAACCDPAAPARLAYVQEAYRVHDLNYGGGLALFQRRYERDLDRLRLTRDAMHQMTSEAANQLASDDDDDQ